MNSREPFDLLRIRQETFIRNISFRYQVESTNTLALELIAGGRQPTPLLVITDCQTAGRGRGPNRWWSTEGALTFSVDDATAYPLLRRLSRRTRPVLVPWKKPASQPPPYV